MPVHDKIGERARDAREKLREAPGKARKKVKSAAYGGLGKLDIGYVKGVILFAPFVYIYLKTRGRISVEPIEEVVI